MSATTHSPAPARRHRRSTAGLAVAAAVLLATSACGGGGSSRPSADSISKALRSSDSVFGSAASKLDQKSADCLAKLLHDSKLSDKTLKAIVKKDKDYKGSSADNKVLTSLTSQAKDCVPNSAD